MRSPRVIATLALAAAAAVLPMVSAVAAEPPQQPRAKAATPTDLLKPEEGPTTKVVNGTRTTVKENPHLITGLRVGGGGPQGASCTASVVGKRKILTAAHCMIDVSGDKSYLYGDDDLNTTGDETFRTKVASYKVHPKYTGPNSWRNGYDVAVITTVDDIPVPQDKWAKVAGSGDSALTAPGKSGQAMGWGKVSAGGSSGVLYKTTMPVNDPANCQVFDVTVNGDTMVCVGYNDGRTGTCSGDSGGPYTVDGVVVGVVSWGAGNCDRYSIMARLTNEMGDWAKKEIGGDTPIPGKFTVGLNPSSGKVEPGKYVSTTVTSTAADTGAEDVQLSVSGLPSGANAVFQPDTIRSGETSKVTFTTSADTPKGTHKLTLSGKGTSGTATAEYTLTVGDGGGGGEIAASASPASVTVQRGMFAETTVTVTGGTGTISLKGTGQGMSFPPMFFPQTVSPGGSSKMTAFAPFNPGTYPITITATDSNGKTATTTFTVTVQ